MIKRTFDDYVKTLYPVLCKYYVAKYGERAQDALHDALLGIYENKAYARVVAKGSYIKPFLKRAIMFGLGNQGSKYKNNEGRTVALDEEQEIHDKSELQTDVRIAIGKLSLEHQNLVKAIFYDGETLREVALKTGQTVYHVFSEFEIAKACLRESLKDYAPVAYRIK